MMARVASAFALLTLAACATAEDSSDTADAADTAEDTPLSFSVAWGADAVVLTLVNGEGDYDWGMAQTANEGDLWTGEDCKAGYTHQSGTVYQYCHPASATGASLTYGGNVATLDEATQTVFTGEQFTSLVTHYVASATDGTCWTSGEDVSYYAAEGCTVVP